MCLVMPHQIFAIPSSIARIVRIFEGQDRQKSAKAKSGEAMVGSVDGAANASQSADPSPLSNAQQARLAIDEAIKDSKLVNHPATWYYRGVIYDRLLRDHIASEEASTLLNEALAAYAQAKKLGLQKNKQLHSFAVGNLAALWRYFLNRGMGYYRQEVVDQAIEQFVICRRILPEKPTPLLYMAIVYHNADQPEAALRYYQDYVAVQGPQFAVARAMAAIHYHKLKNFDKAITILNAALLQFSFNNELLEEKCLIYEASGKINDYAASLAVGVQHKKIDACYAYAYLLEYQGRMQEAIRYYQQVLKDHPYQYDTLLQIGFLFYNEAIKLYVHTLKSVGDKAQLENPRLVDWCGSMQVTVRCLLSHAREWIGIDCLLPVWMGWFPRPFSASLRWVVYDHPLAKHSKISSLHHLVQAGMLPYTSPLYGYIHTKNATELAGNKWVETIAALEKYLKKSLYYLKVARAQDKKDKAVAQALYYGYYHLKKYGSAYRLLRAMQKQKQYLEDDPFMEHKARE
ncbi:Putative PEP-CTERM system TPR-repeat lipoprotein [Cardinium endosymbiont of Oedothorax gibbosus]|nr:Putative PEP-CTERM system TPR-repeat lipoprotein [Cardinium endosymbiont of Oedothorax gibbosus]